MTNLILVEDLPHDIKCRCLYCGSTNKMHPQIMYFASKKRYGRGDARWGICELCLENINIIHTEVKRNLS